MTDNHQATRPARTGEPSVPRDVRALAARMDHIREEEREHLARELHDHFGQSLTALKLSLHGMLEARPTDEEYERRIANMMAMCDAIIEDVRRVSHTLRPSILDELCLRQRLPYRTLPTKTWILPRGWIVVVQDAVQALGHTDPGPLHRPMGRTALIP